MLFSSSVFLLLFLPIILLLYFNPWFRSRKFRNVVLLIASIFFYAWGASFCIFNAGIYYNQLADFATD